MVTIRNREGRTSRRVGATAGGLRGGRNWIFGPYRGVQGGGGTGLSVSEGGRFAVDPRWQQGCCLRGHVRS